MPRSSGLGAYFLRTSAHFRREPGANQPFRCRVTADFSRFDADCLRTSWVSIYGNGLTFAAFPSFPYRPPRTVGMPLSGTRITSYRTP